MAKVVSYDWNIHGFLKMKFMQGDFSQKFGESLLMHSDPNQQTGGAPFVLISSKFSRLIESRICEIILIDGSLEVFKSDKLIGFLLHAYCDLFWFGRTCNFLCVHIGGSTKNIVSAIANCRAQSSLWRPDVLQHFLIKPSTVPSFLPVISSRILKSLRYSKLKNACTDIPVSGLSWRCARCSLLVIFHCACWWVP